MNSTTGSPTTLSVLARLADYVDLGTDGKLTDPLDLVSALYKRIRLESDLKAIDQSGSWDYCKAAARDFKMKVRRWIPIHEDAATYQRCCVPPLLQTSNMMMVGEAYSGDFHLTVFHRADNTYWCCLLTRKMVEAAQRDPQLRNFIEFADIPMMGVPEPNQSE